jgi:hypothetical protein
VAAELFALVVAVGWAMYRFVRSIRAAEKRIDGLLADFDQRYPRDVDNTMSSDETTRSRRNATFAAD